MAESHRPHAHAVQARLDEIDDEIQKWQDYIEFAASDEEDYRLARSAIIGLKAERMSIEK